jgi:hypothetical protein
MFRSSASNFAAGSPPLTTCLAASGTSFLDSVAPGLRGFVVTNAPQNGSFLQLVVTKTNGFVVTVSVTNTPGNTNGGVFVKALVDAINGNEALVDVDGVVVQDFVSYDVYLGRPGGEFNLLARNSGWPESQIQAQLSGSSDFGIGPSGTSTWTTTSTISSRAPICTLPPVSPTFRSRSPSTRRPRWMGFTKSSLWPMRAAMCEHKNEFPKMFASRTPRCRLASRALRERRVARSKRH